MYAYDHTLTRMSASMLPRHGPAGIQADRPPHCCVCVGIVTDLRDKWTLLWVAGSTIYTNSPTPRATAVAMINS